MNKSVVAAAIALASAISPAFANSFMNIDFSGDTIGSAPNTTFPSAPSPVTQPYAIGGYSQNTPPANIYGDTPPTADDGTVTVQNVDTLSKAAVLAANPNNNQTGAIWLDTQYLVTANTMSLSFDINVVNSTASINADPSFQFNLNGDAGNKVGLLFDVNQFTADGSIFGFGAAPTSATGGSFGFRNANGTDFNTVFDYTNGITYHVEIDADFNSQTISAAINNTSVLSGYGMRAGKTSNLLTESFFFINGQPTTSGVGNSVALDNIVGAAPVPLPSALGSGLALLATLGLFSQAKRLRSVV